MTYQIARESQIQMIEGEGTQKLYVIRPTRDVRLNFVTVQMLLKGHLNSDFKMRINVYSGTEGGRLLFSSKPVSVSDIERTNDYYFDLRFDFDLAGNVWSINKDHLIELEIYDGYVYNLENYLALILDYFAGQAFFGTDVDNIGSEDKLSHKVGFFFEVKDQVSSEEFYMIQVEASRLISRADNIQTFTQGSHTIFKCFIEKDLNDTGGQLVLTNDSPLPYISIAKSNKPLDFVLSDVNKYYYDRETGEISFCLKYNSNPIMSDYTYAYLLIDHKILLTTDYGRSAPIDLTGGVEYYWEPRIKEAPLFTYSQENLLSGILSISTSSISINNEDKFFFKFIRRDSFFDNRLVKIFKCRGSYKNIIRSLEAIITGVSGDNETVTLEIDDNSISLDQVYKDSYPLTWGEVVGANPHPDDTKKIIPRMFGRTSPYNTYYYDTKQKIALDPSRTIFLKALDPSNMIRAVNVSRSENFTTSSNRLWGCCIGPSSVAPSNFTAISVTHVTDGTYLFTEVLLSPHPYGSLEESFSVGDCVINGSQVGIVSEVFSDRIHIWPRNTSMNVFSQFVKSPVSAVVIKSQDLYYYPLAGRDYTVNLDTYGILRILFTNNFEANFSGLGTLDPDKMEVSVKVWNKDGDNTSSSVVKKILNQAGVATKVDFSPPHLPSPSESGDGLFTYPDPILSFVLPFSDNKMPNYRDILERLLRSSVSYIYVDNSGEWGWDTFLRSYYRDVEGNETTEYAHNPSGLNLTGNELTLLNSAFESFNFNLYETYTRVSIKSDFRPEFEFSDGVNFFARVEVEEILRGSREFEFDSLCDTGSSYFRYFFKALFRFITGRRTTSIMSSLDDSKVSIGDTVINESSAINNYLARVVEITDSEEAVRVSLSDLEIFPFNNPGTF